MSIIKKYKDEILYFQLDKFKELDYIDHLFTSRIGWSNENIKKNISYIFNLPEDNIINVKQVHGSDIMVIDSETKDFRGVSNLEKDGLITNIPGIALITYHADCVPIYFLDKKQRVIGMAHGGWKGTYNNINEKMINTMKKVFACQSEDILVGIGPSIGPCCYEIGEDLGEKFTNRYKDFKGIIEIRNNKTYLNLWQVNYLQLLEKGILKENIMLSKTCTSCRVDELYSYRKENGTKKRMAAAISLVNNMDN